MLRLNFVTKVKSFLTFFFIAERECHSNLDCAYLTNNRESAISISLCCISSLGTICFNLSNQNCVSGADGRGTPRLMPIRSACSKIFWQCSNFFDRVQYLFTTIKSDILPYKFAFLSMDKNIWPHSKNIERGQKFWKQPKWFLN